MSSAPTAKPASPVAAASSTSPDTTAEPLSKSVTGASTMSSTARVNPSLLTRFQESAPPSGMWSATGELAAKAPTLRDIRRGSFSNGGWSAEGQHEERRRRGSSVSEADSNRRRLSKTPTAPQTPTGGIARTKTASSGGAFQDQDLAETAIEHDDPAITASAAKGTTATNGQPASSNTTSIESHPAHGAGTDAHPTVYPNGYQFPPKHTWPEATSIALRATVAFVTTPLGFLITIYGLNVVAWGGMLFLLLCNASPAMCHPSCNDINSSRRIWIEIDSQILNALFCVTGFGLIPWRFRDLYYLLKWRVWKQTLALRRLGGIHSGWFRLPGSQELDPAADAAAAAAVTETTAAEGAAKGDAAIPYPPAKAASPPLTGIRAPSTALWKLDFVIWLFVWNTFLQVVLSTFMWKYNRITRPSWSTGLFVALACIVAGAAGFMQFKEGKKVKDVEGVPVSEEDLVRLKREGGDVEKGEGEGVGVGVVGEGEIENGLVMEEKKHKWYELRSTDKKVSEKLRRRETGAK